MMLMSLITDGIYNGSAVRKLKVSLDSAGGNSGVIMENAEGHVEFNSLKLKAGNLDMTK